MSTNQSSRAQCVNDDKDKQDLLVFGYACKLFRDDEKAELIEEGAHLIPWMGDDTLRIDRYDGRGHLYDLTQYEAKSENVNWSDSGGENSEEDEMCEYERYRSLYLDEVAELTYKEEHAKRIQLDHAEIQYNYDNPVNDPSLPMEGSQTSGQPFVPPAELQVPATMRTPTTAKHNAIIIRTALFLAQQGSQMEILMKVKQQSNRNFDFLSHTDQLHEYYKHVLGLIKSGAYVPQEQHLDDTSNMAASETNNSNNSNNNRSQGIGHVTKEDPADSGDHYLHPSLITKLTTSSVPSPPSTTGAESKPSTTVAPPRIETAPPDYVQKIIEKMVKYVIKNGPPFEAAILKRGDVRFSFLNSKNPYNIFYKEQLAAKQKEIGVNNLLYMRKEEEHQLKKRLEKKMEKDDSSLHQQSTTESDSDSKSASDTVLKRKPLPVSFSIKKAKENEGLEVPSALPIEESSDEEDLLLQQPNNNSSSSPQLTSSCVQQQQQQQPLQQQQQVLQQKNLLDSADLEFINALDKRLKKSTEVTKKHKLKKDANLQNERKLKVAQFLKDLKKKS